MKILFVTNMYPSEKEPAYGIFVKEQIQDVMKSLKCKFDIYVIKAKKWSKLMYLVSIFHIPVKMLQEKYDIIHIHYGISALFLFFYKPKAKVFLTLHGGDILIDQGNKLQVYLTKRLLSKVDRVFILNNEMEELIKPLCLKYDIIPCGVDKNFFTAYEKKSKDEEVKLILFPGNSVVHVKNFPLFLSVIDELKKICDFSINYQCIHSLSREGVVRLLNKSDCLLMTSISEGSPQLVKEAIFCGIPVVSVPVGDVREMVAKVPHCYVSNSYNPVELARLVLLSFRGRGASIRNAFVQKNIYDSCSVTKRIVQNYYE